MLSAFAHALPCPWTRSLPQHWLTRLLLLVFEDSTKASALGILPGHRSHPSWARRLSFALPCQAGLPVFAELRPQSCLSPHCPGELPEGRGICYGISCSLLDPWSDAYAWVLADACVDVGGGAVLFLPERVRHCRVCCSGTAPPPRVGKGVHIERGMEQRRKSTGVCGGDTHTHTHTAGESQGRVVWGLPRWAGPGAWR